MSNIEDFPYPYTVDTLPQHNSWNLTEQERAALGPWTRIPDRPGKGFLTLASEGDGKVVLYPEHMNGDDPMSQIKYYPQKSEDPSTYSRVDENGREFRGEARDRRHRLISGSELGSGWSQDLVAKVFDYARTQHIEGSVEQQLAQAGFAQQSEKVYRKKHGRGSYALFIKDHGMWLMFEPRGADHWHNLLLLNTHTCWQNENNVSPLDWPQTVNDPTVTIAGMMIHMSQIWTPDMIPRQKKAKIRAVT